MNLGLRVDVDTYRGTCRGVPRLLETLARHRILASFFFSVGPDNMGRHLLRLVRPEFLRKMRRSQAASLYGWDILLRGTLWPGPRIGERCAGEIRRAARGGHEIGLHAWDHHAWQAHLEEFDREDVAAILRRGMAALEEAAGQAPTCSAVPGWRCNDLVLECKESLPFAYNSDCRGTSVFAPVAGGRRLSQLQVPVTLPTYDEVVGRDGVSDSTYNEVLLGRLDPRGLNVLTIHAEVEGIACAALFDDFVQRARVQGVHFVPLSHLLPEPSVAAEDRIVDAPLPGREGVVSWQRGAVR